MNKVVNEIKRKIREKPWDDYICIYKRNLLKLIGQLSQEKPKIVILEGCDGVGKSSVRVLISNYNGNYFILERFTPSIYAYGKLYNRDIDLTYIAEVESALLRSFRVCPIFLFCSIDELYKRFKRGKHVVTLKKYDLMAIQDEMKKFIDDYSLLNWKKIDNTSRSPEKTFKMIKEVYKL